jgi:hypothetical protein
MNAFHLASLANELPSRLVLGRKTPSTPVVFALETFSHRMLGPWVDTLTVIHTPLSSVSCAAYGEAVGVCKHILRAGIASFETPVVGT